MPLLDCLRKVSSLKRTLDLSLSKEQNYFLLLPKVLSEIADRLRLAAVQ